MSIEHLSIPISLEHIREAANRLSSRVEHTRHISCEALDRLLNAQVYFKCENEQSMGAFKIRGATNKLLSLSTEEAARGVVTHSSGNHAQALALAASGLEIESHIVIPANAPALKVRKTREYGGQVYFCEPTAEARQSTVDEMIAEHSYVFVPPYNDWAIIAGQGTATLEFLEDAGPFDILLCPVGGGGLISGAAITSRGLGASTAVIGVEPLGADDALRSLRTGTLTRNAQVETIADGLRGNLGDKTFSVIRALVDDIVTVDDAAIVRAMRFAYEHMGLRLEPSGAICLAALLSQKLDISGKRLGVLLSGGNISTEDFERLITSATEG